MCINVKFIIIVCLFFGKGVETQWSATNMKRQKASKLCLYVSKVLDLSPTDQRDRFKCL